MTEMMYKAQAFILNLLESDNQTGRFLRESLANSGVRWSGPWFYQVMATMEDAGHVEGWYEDYELDGQPFRLRWYRLTEGGRRAVSSHENIETAQQTWRLGLA